MTSTFLALLLATSTSPAGAYVVDSGGSVVRFHLHHKMHEVDGRSSQIEGKVVLGDDGKVMAMIRMPASSFDTGDANRDSHMREALEAAKFPYVVFKGVTNLIIPVAYGKPIETKLQGELEFHGVKQPLTVPAEISLAQDGSAVVKARFSVNLESHRIERPSLLFIKVDENVLLDVELKLKGAK